MLAEKIKKTTSALKELHQVEHRSTQEQAYKKILTEVQAASALGVNWLTYFKLLHNWDKEKFQKPEFNETIAQIDLIITKLTSESDSPKATQLQPVKDYFEKLILNLKGAWESYILSKSESNLDMLSALEGIIGKTVVASKKQSIKSLSETWPPDVEVINQLTKNLADINGLISGLNVTQKIIHFLIRVQTEEARLDELNCEIEEWLDNHSVKRKIKLSFVD